MEEFCCCQGHCGRVLLLSGSLWKSIVAVRVTVEECCCCQGHCGRVLLLSGLCGRVLLLSVLLWKSGVAHKVTVEVFVTGSLWKRVGGIGVTKDPGADCGMKTVCPTTSFLFEANRY